MNLHKVRLAVYLLALIVFLPSYSPAVELFPEAVTLAELQHRSSNRKSGPGFLDELFGARASRRAHDGSLDRAIPL